MWGTSEETVVRESIIRKWRESGEENSERTVLRRSRWWESSERKYSKEVEREKVKRVEEKVVRETRKRK